MFAIVDAAVEADAPPRHEADPLLVMDLQAIYAQDAARRNQPEARANAQAAWRRAYFEALKRKLIEP